MDPAEFGISTVPLLHEPYSAISHEQLANTNTGKVAVVTGAAGGIGAAIAESIAKTGASLAILDLSAEHQATTKATCEKAGVKVVAYSCDVADLEGTKIVFDQIDVDLGPIDILVNCAGIIDQRPLVMATVESVWRQVEVNLKGPLITSYLALPRMRQRRQGCIVNIASRSGTVDVPMCIGYNTSKAAVIRLTHTLQKEMELDGFDDAIQLYALHPGGVWTGLASTASAEDVKEKYGIPKDEAYYKPLFKDPPSLCGQTCAFLSAGKGKELRGFYLDCRQDITKLLAAGRETLKKEKLNTLGLESGSGPTNSIGLSLSNAFAALYDKK